MVRYLADRTFQLRFSVKTVLAEEENFVPTKEGLTVELDTALLYRLDPAGVPDLYLSVGDRYEEVVIKPEVRLRARMNNIE